MTEQEISNKCKSLDASNDTFKNIIKDCKNPKFNNLDKWQHFQAMAFKKENNPNIKTGSLNINVEQLLWLTLVHP
jgi:hypothetical protein